MNGKAVDLSLVMQLRRDNERLEETVKQLRENNQLMHDQLRATHAQLLVVLYKQPGHEIHITEHDYDILPRQFMFSQENYSDGSYTVRVLTGDEMEQAAKGPSDDETTH